MKIKSQSITDVNITDKVVVLKENVLQPQNRTIGNRLHRATGGFGCRPNTIGSAVFATCLGDGKDERWARGDFEGWITDDEANALMVKERVVGPTT